MTTIAIDFDLAQKHGVNAAIVHQQIAWSIKSGRFSSHAEGWYTATLDELARICPISVRQIRRAIDVLVDSGLLERHAFRVKRHDQTMSYRPVEPGNPLNGPVDREGNSIGTDRSTGVDREGKSSFAPEGICTSLFEKEKTTCPPDGGPPEVPLTDSQQSSALFEDWWASEYPNSKQDGRNRGKKHAAHKAWSKLHRAGVTHSQILDRTRRYAKAREVFQEHHGASVVEAPLMHGSTFLNGEHENWAERCQGHTDERIRYWIGPLRTEIERAKTSTDPTNGADPFDTAWSAFLAAQNDLKPAEAAERALTSQPDVWTALRRSWPAFATGNRFQARDAFQAHYQTLTLVGATQ